MKQPTRQRRQPPPYPTTSPNLLGEPCTHVWRPFRGYVMCVQPMCGALCRTDGMMMSRTQVMVLLDRLRYEQGDWPSMELPADADGNASVNQVQP